MTKMTGRWRVIWTIFVLSIVLIFAVAVGMNRLSDSSPAPAGASVSSQPVAVVNGVAITQEMIDRELKISRLNVAAPLAPLSGEDLAVAQEEALNQLISRQLVLQAARQQGFSLDEATIEARADLLYGTYSDEEIDRALAQIEASRDDLLWWIGQIFTAEEFTTDILLADVPVDSRQQFYNDWFNSLRAEAQIKIYAEGDTPQPQALIGEPAPNFTLTTLTGDPAALSDYRGKVVLVNFWATWCPSCVTELPDYEQVYQEYEPSFVVLGVNLQESPAEVERYATGLGLTFPMLLDQDGRVTNRQYQVTGMPGSFIVDRQGNIFYRHVGPMRAETLRAKLAELGL